MGEPLTEALSRYVMDRWHMYPEVMQLGADMPASRAEIERLTAERYAITVSAAGAVFDRSRVAEIETELAAAHGFRERAERAEAIESRIENLLNTGYLTAADRVLVIAALAGDK
jgi:hypothetical protein